MLVAGIVRLILLPEELADTAARILSVGATVGIFVLQVLSMRKDLPGVSGYHLGATPPRQRILPAVPSRRPYFTD